MSKVDKLIELKSMMSSGLITEDEFKKFKDELTREEGLNSPSGRKIKYKALLWVLFGVSLLLAIIYFGDTLIPAHPRIGDHLAANEKVIWARYEGMQIEFDYPMFSVSDSGHDELHFINQYIGNIFLGDKLVEGKTYGIIYENYKMSEKEKAELAKKAENADEEDADYFQPIEGDFILSVFDEKGKPVIVGLTAYDRKKLIDAIILFQEKYFKENASTEVIPFGPDEISFHMADINEDGYMDILYDFNGFTPHFKDGSGNASWYCGFPYFENTAEGFQYRATLDGELNDGTYEPQMEFKSAEKKIIWVRTYRHKSDDPRCCPSIERYEKYTYANNEFRYIGSSNSY